MIPKDLFIFLSELKENNTREWFQDNKKRYEDSVRTPLLEFIVAFEPRLEKISPYFMAVAKKSGGSLFRIFRDVRFSKDKAPYKTNAGLHFRHENGKDAHAPGFYLHLEAGRCFCAGGLWKPDSASLKLIREAIAEKPAEWEKVSQNSAFELWGDSLKRPPRGFPADHLLVEDLKRKDHVAAISLTEEDVLKESFLDDFTGHCQSMAAYMAFLCKALRQPY